MQTLKRVLAVALQEAQSGFGTLCKRMTDRADVVLSEISRAAPAADQRMAGFGRSFLREHGPVLRSRMERAYAALLARAMQTMHTDLRTGLHDFSAETLTLIDDATVTRQIEVERLLLKLRDADEMSLGHLNLIIAQMHGDSEVRERENPFRPYLLARSLYDVLRTMVEDEALSKLLFDTLSQAMTAELGDFYTRLREVFESRGIRSRLVARPSALNKLEKDRLAWQRAATGHADTDQGMRQRVEHLGSLQKELQPKEDLQELVYSVFNPSDTRRTSHPAHEHFRQQLDGALRQLQREYAGAGPRADVQSPLDLLKRLANLPRSNERIVVELVGLLFEFILNDELLPRSMREQLCRLHAPFLRSALQDLGALQGSHLPGRRLLDRIGSAAAGIGADSPLLDPLQKEVERVVDLVLKEYEHDAAVFADAELELDGFLASLLRECDPVVRRCLPSFERALQAAPKMAATAAALRSQLETINVDPRMLDFITGTWVPVMVHTHGREKDYGKLLPELVWSAHEKALPEERAALMKMLPALGRELRAGLALIGMEESDAQAALDQLVSLHMDVLSNNLPPATTSRLSVAALRARFSAVGLDQQIEADALRTDALPTQAQFRAEFALDGIQAAIPADPAPPGGAAGGEEWLEWAHAGNGFELRTGDAYAPWRLSVVAPHEAAFLFTAQGQAAPLVYSRAALLAAMRDGSLRPLEYSPLFERAVESLMTGAESLDAA
ncbi:DUF1631 family protein [Pseudoduganella violaceinigra]|uniref:DUF1631 family protein n=1 Tax=Pseudoduganella violaceinigra TaxID=246602 RepID=UPI000A06C6A6|nr:DUF1631 family protein [Pseudoduganella violaceinigra]